MGAGPIVVLMAASLLGPTGCGDVRPPNAGPEPTPGPTVAPSPPLPPPPRDPPERQHPPSEDPPPEEAPADPPPEEAPADVVGCPPDAEPGQLLWRFEAEGKITGAPAVDEGGGVVFGTHEGTLISLDAGGGLRWSFDYPQFDARYDYWSVQAFEGSPAIDDDGVIYAGDNFSVPNYLFAFDPDGETLWVEEFLNIYSRIDASPALDGRRVIIGSYGISKFGHHGTLRSYPLDGEGARLYAGTGPIMASPVVLANGDTVALAGHHGGSYRWEDLPPALHLVGQEEIVVGARFDGEGPFSSLATDGRHVLFFQRGEGLVAWRAVPTFERLWSYGEPAEDSSFPRPDGFLRAPLIGTPGEITEVIAVSGDPPAIQSLRVAFVPDEVPELAWERKLVIDPSGTGALGADGLLYLAGGASVFALDRATGERVWRRSFHHKFSSPVTLSPDGVLLVGTEEGSLLALCTDSGGLDPEAAWPSFRHDARNTGNVGARR